MTGCARPGGARPGGVSARANDGTAIREETLMRLDPNRKFVAYAGAAAFCLLAYCAAALAVDAYQWSDADGIVQTTLEPPSMGVTFQKIGVLPPVPWNNPPGMPEEIAAGGARSAQDLFKAAAQSVYWIFPGGIYFGYAVAITEELALTNCQVILNAGQEPMIGAIDLAQPARVEIVAADYLNDRCIIKARDLRLRPVAGIRRFDTLNKGETFYAISNPRRPDRALTNGELSEIVVYGPQRQLKTTVPIAPSSSGVGIFDNRGNLVGVTSSYLRDTRILSIAIPAEDFWK
jgi:hypothetical protein